MFKISSLYILFLIGLLSLCNLINAQYFGQNKPSYEKFNFQLYKTPHFDIYHYLKSDSLLNDLAIQAEEWYHYHEQILLDTFQVPNPMLVYSNHADFQQTNAIHGLIGVGTGGVTEGYKKRIVFPLSFSTYQTHHVIGHEMVHAFQYDMLENYTMAGLASVHNIPLWMIEGMSEYLSIGNYDTQTVIWMRDALIHNNFPDLKKLSTNLKYSPYRFGHAFWSYISNTYGEQYIRTLFLETAEKGLERAIKDVFFISMDSLSTNFKLALQNHLIKNVNDSVLTIYGNKIETKKNAGSYNLSPSVSPDGKYLVFLSEKDIFSLDLWLADAKTGNILRKLYTSTRKDNIDAISFLETSGTWSPDSKYFVYIGFIKGKSALILFNVKKNKIEKEIILHNMDAVSYPVWSPSDPDKIVFTGLTNGQSDLFLFNKKEEKVINLTKNRYTAIQAKWQPDGKGLYYSTDEPVDSPSFQCLNQYNIAHLNLESHTHKVLTTFDGAQNLNPVINKDGTELYFLSDRDGSRNIYCYLMQTHQILQVTKYSTGVMGLSFLSPALDISGNTLYYTIITNGTFSIVKTNTEQLKSLSTVVERKSFDLYASRLLPYSKFFSSVDENITGQNVIARTQIDSFYTKPIKSKFKLDYIGNTAIGIMASRYGSGMVGSIQTRFSDILGEHVLYSGLSVNGKIYDFGGLIAYMNQKRKVKTGVSISHIPYQTAYYSYDEESNLQYYFRRTFVDKVSFFSYIPINKTHRIEFGISGANYSYRTEKIEDYDYYYSYISQKSKVVESPDPFRAFIIDAAWIIDNSTFGLTAPISGKRIRIGFEKYLLGIDINNILIDYRKYFYLKPYTLAVRIFHYGRYGNDNNKFYDLYLGYPWYIRGYESGKVFGSEENGKITMEQLSGTKMMLTNFEFRIPFSGPRKYALLKSRTFYSDLALFYDSGIAWGTGSEPTWDFTTSSVSKRIPIMSTGAALRINLFGVFIIEPYYAFPIYQGTIHPGNFSINLLAGW